MNKVFRCMDIVIAVLKYVCFTLVALVAARQHNDIYALQQQVQQLQGEINADGN